MSKDDQLVLAQRQYIDRLCNHLDCTTTALARRAGVAPSTINRFMGDDMPSHALSSITLAKLAAYSGVAFSYEGAFAPASLMIPVLGSVPGGSLKTILAREATGEIEYPSRGRNLFALKVEGNSVNRVAPDGAFVVIDPQRKNVGDLDGALVLAEVDDEATVKKLRLKPVIRLEPDSTDPSFQPIYPDNREWRVAGAVICAIRPLETKERA